MTSCGDTFIVSVRKSTRTIFSRKGMMKLSPGPRNEMRRPKRNTTPRSYSLKTLRPVRTTPRRMTKKMIVESNNSLSHINDSDFQPSGYDRHARMSWLEADENFQSENGIVIIYHLASIARLLQPRVMLHRPSITFRLESRSW